MAIQNKTQLKSYFTAGSRPTQAQFAHLIDSMALVTDLPGGASAQQPIPVDPEITLSDIGKLAMLDYDGEIRIYQESPAQEGIEGQWRVVFTGLSASYHPFTYADIKREIDVQASAWLGAAATPAEEAANFISYINSQWGDMLEATDSSSDGVVAVTLTQVERLFVNDAPTFGNGGISVSTTVSPIPAVPAAPKRLCIGIIQHVDPINHLAYFDNVYVVHAETAPDIPEVLAQAENNHVLYHLLVLLQLVALPASNGRVRRFEMVEDIFQDPTYIFTSLQNAMYMFLKPHHVTGRYYVMRRLLG
jgi:hypothetical protein